jgi:two-component system, NarL family, sensor histidine kinase BarA
MDKMRTLQILINLISNALKFSKENETVQVRCIYFADLLDLNSFVVSMEVSDKGIGITEEDQRNIFKPFFKTKDAESRALNATSHGLGLSICSQIAKGLGGEVTFKSVQGEGSHFTFTFKA